METKKEESSAVSCQSVKDPKLLNVMIDKKLYEVLSPVVRVNQVTTLSKVFESLKLYICQKQLFDPLDPSKIHLKNDELSSVFGLSDCFISDVMRCIPKIVYPVIDKHAGIAYPSNPLVGSKRRIENESGESGVLCFKTGCSADSSTNIIDSTDEIPSKKAKTECIFLMIPPSPSQISTSSSCESIQDYETSVVKDSSSDDNSHSENDSFSIIAVEETYDLEYEISSDSGEISDDSDDGTLFSSAEDALNSIFHFICESDTDIEYLADQSENDADDEISESDQWQCAACSYSKNSPFARTCHKCFQVRNGWLPPATNKEKDRRQRRKRKSKRKRATKMENNSPIDKCEMEEGESHTSSKSNESSMSCVPSSSSLEESSTKITHLNYNNLVTETSISTNLDSNRTYPTCILCCDQPANGTIIHRNSKFAHTFCCYKCAMKLKHNLQKCPVCRRSIDRVVYSILS